MAIPLNLDQLLTAMRADIKRLLERKTVLPDPNAGLITGEVRLWAGPAANAPLGFLVCDGSAVSRTNYAALFGLIGTTYGPGNGTTTFNVPDLREKVPFGASATTGYTLGSKGGSATNTHNHIQSIGADDGSVYTSVYRSQPRSVVRNRMRFIASSTPTNTGARLDSTDDETIAIVPPYVAMNYIIRT